MRCLFLQLSFLLAVALAVTATGGCSLIDERLEDCTEEFKMTYHLRLVTNVEVQLKTRLSDMRDEALRQALEKHLGGVFAEYARDIDLSFYATDEEGRRLEHRTAVMDADQATYEIDLPARDYDHLALANVASEPQVRLTGDDYRDQSLVVQTAAEHVPSQVTGLFSARKSMTVRRDESETFDVNLYMLNSAVAVVLHRDSCDFVTASCELLDLADGFRVSDSVYTFTRATQVETLSLPVDTVGRGHWNIEPALFCGVALPSRDSVATRADGDEPETLWRAALNVTLQDGSVTRTEIAVASPLLAGNLMVLRGYLHENGGFEPEPVPDMVLGGVSVSLNWKNGNQFDPEL